LTNKFSNKFGQSKKTDQLLQKLKTASDMDETTLKDAYNFKAELQK